LTKEIIEIFDKRNIFLQCIACIPLNNLWTFYYSTSYVSWWPALSYSSFAGCFG